MIYIWSKMLSSYLYTLLKVSKTTYPQILFAFDCVTLYFIYVILLYNFRRQTREIKESLNIEKRREKNGFILDEDDIQARPAPFQEERYSSFQRSDNDIINTYSVKRVEEEFKFLMIQKIIYYGDNLTR